MSHWATKKEKAGSLWQMRLVFNLYKGIGFKGIRFFLHPVAFFYYLFSPSTRKISYSFLEKVHKQNGSSEKIGMREVYRHIYSFSFSLIEKLAAWTGDIHSRKLILKTPDIETLKKQLSEKQGAVIISSHLGNIEMLRAFADQESNVVGSDFQINPLVDFSVTSTFNRLLEEVNPGSMVNLVHVSSIDASTIIKLQEKLSQGEIVSIAGDRTAKNNQSRSTSISFLGEEAAFPQGAFILASLLEAPVYYIFAVRQEDRDFSSPYEFHVFKTKYDFKTSRKDRNKKIHTVTEEFAGYLETLCKSHPYQWYNFFDFWDNPHKMKTKGEE